MGNQLTALDIQFIRASLTSKSDGEIAAMLEVPVEVVHEKINQLTAGGAEARSMRIQQIKELQYSKIRGIEEAKANQRLAKQKRAAATEQRRLLNKEASDKKEKERREKVIRMNQSEHRQKDKKLREGRSKFKTRDLHMDQLISVKIDHKTTVFVKPGTDIAKIKKQYTRSLEENIKSKN